MGELRTEFKKRTEQTARPARRWRLLVVLLITLGVVGVFLFGAVNFTNSASFCSSCHEMKPEYITFKASAHNQIKCIECHAEPGIKNELKYKGELLHMAYQSIVGSPGQIFPVAHVSNQSCENCHSRNRLVTATGDIIVNHDAHIEKDIPCITCHRGVVHAKIAERGINESADYPAWTEENAKKLMGDKFEKPNMGTCIDCHVKVNQGKRPWVAEAYSLPALKDDREEEETSMVFYETPEMRAGVLERKLPEAKQKNILEAMAQQHSDVKLSMQCTTCHRKIDTPETHDRKNWAQSHGEVAVNEAEKCLGCHQDSLWIKELDKQDVITLLTKPEKKQAIPKDLVSVTKESRKNYFCSTCHAYFPKSHQDRYNWLTDTHRHVSASPEERRTCFVCHDNQKPDQQTDTAPSDVYCEFCHEGDFPGEP